MMPVREGAAILIVEDEPLVAMLLEDMLGELGVAVVGPATHLEDGLRLAQDGGFDAAILDINLGGNRSFAIADELDRRGIRFSFATGYGNAGVEGRYQHIPLLTKPYMADDVRRLIAILLPEQGQ